MTYLTSVASGIDDAGSTTRDSPSLTLSGSGKVLWAAVGSSSGTPVDSSGAVWDPSGANQAMTKQGSTLNFGTFAKFQLYRLINPTNATAAVRATWGSSQEERLVIAWAENDTDQATPNGTVAAATGTGATVSAGAVTTTAGQRVLMFAMALRTAVFSGPTEFDSPTGTERHDGVLTGTAYDAFAAQEQTASGSSTTPTWTLNEGVDGWAAFAFALNAQSSGGGVIGLVSETDQALPMTWTDFGQLGDLFIFGDDTGFESSMGGLKVFGGFLSSALLATIGQASETDTAQAFTRLLTLAIGQATETGSALALTARQSKTIGQPSETDLAQPVAQLQARAVGQASETNSAQQLVVLQFRGAGQAAEADSAFALSGRQTSAIGQPIESDLAQPVLLAGTGLAIGQVLEVDTAQAFAASQRKAVGQVSETDVAQPLAAAQARAIGIVAETDLAQSVARLQARAIGQVLEVDLSQQVSGAGGLLLGQPAEVDAAQAVVGAQRLGVGLVSEIDTAQAFTRVIGRTVGQSVELDTAQAFSAAQRAGVGQVSESDSAGALVAGARRTVGLVTETDAAQAVQWRLAWQLAQAQEIGQALAFTAVGQVVVPTWPAGGPSRIGSGRLSSSGGRLGGTPLTSRNRRIG